MNAVSGLVEARFKELARRVRNQLHRRPELREVSVDARQGAIVLHGRVSTFYLKQLCISGGRRVAGVYELVDDIRVE